MRTLAALLVVTVALAGCTAVSLDPPNKVRVVYAGSWSGAILDDDGSRSVDGVGEEVFHVKGGIVSVNFQKKDDSSRPLLVEILSDEKVLKTQTTTAAYGVAGAATN